MKWKTSLLAGIAVLGAAGLLIECGQGAVAPDNGTPKPPTGQPAPTPSPPVGTGGGAGSTDPVAGGSGGGTAPTATPVQPAPPPTDAGGAPSTGAGSLHYAVYGDTRTNFGTHQQVVDRIAALDPQLVIHSGDLWDGYTPAMFAAILRKNANIGRLLDSNLFVASRGNHETVADYLAFKPSLSRGTNSERFSYTVGNSFFVILGMDPTGTAAFLDGELSKPEASAARWRFVQSHFPVYSGGTTHGASGIPSVEKLCDQYQVAVYWSGHDHIYERSHQLFGGQVVDRGDSLSASKGTVYVVSGGGGAPLYGVAKIASTHVQASTNNYVDVVAAPNLLTVKVYKLDGSQLDTFTIAP
jgi:hypothetical protein